MAVDVSLLNSNSLANITTNFERVKEALQDTVGRSGVTPNEMNADLDMNSNDILNVNELDVVRITLDGKELIPQGAQGWSPVYAAEEYNSTIIMRLVDYVGGTGTKPTDHIGQYVGADGYVTNPSDAVGFGSSGVSDGDKGDIAVSGSGTTWTLTRQWPTYQTIDDIIASEQLGPTPILTALSFDSNATSGSSVEFSDAGTIDPSAPGQIEVNVSGIPHFYTRSNKVLRPQQHGVKTGGVAAVNRAGLIEMFNLANYTGHEIDMGDANDVYEIAAGITHVFTKKPIIRGSGATIKLNKAGGAVSQVGLQLLYNQIGFDVEGFTVDAGFDAPRALSIENTNADALDEATIQDGRMVGVSGIRAYTRTDVEGGTRGINVTGWLRNLHAEDLSARDIKIATGAYNINFSTAGIFLGRTVGGAYPLFKDITNPYVDKVYSEDVAQTSNMDAVMIYDAIPGNGLLRPLGCTNIRGGMLRDFWGRGLKVQALNVDVFGLQGDLTSAPTGDQVTSFIDFQFGGGSVHGGSLRCIGKSPKNVFISQSQTYTSGMSTLDNFKYWGSVGTPEPDCLAWHIPDTAGGTRTDGGMTVRDCHTRAIGVKNIVRMSTAAASIYTEKVNVEGNAVSVSAAGIAFEFRSTEQMAAAFRNNINPSTSFTPCYTRKTLAGVPVTNTVSVYGGVPDNWYFSAGT